MWIRNVKARRRGVQIERDRGLVWKAKVDAGIIERKGNWQHSCQHVFPGHERLAAPNRDYAHPLGSPSNEQIGQKERVG